MSPPRVRPRLRRSRRTSAAMATAGAAAVLAATAWLTHPAAAAPGQTSGLRQSGAGARLSEKATRGLPEGGWEAAAEWGVPIGAASRMAASIAAAAATVDTPITYATYGEILARMRALAAAHPHVVRLYAAQDAFGLPSVGSCDESVAAGGPAQPAPCRVWVMDIGRAAGAPSLLQAVSRSAARGSGAADAAADAARPAVLISGAVHGDEVVGPNAAMAFAELLAGAVSPIGSDAASASSSTDPVLRAWLLRLLDTRSVTVIPMTNAVGYATGVRGEDQSPPGGPPSAPLDPNRDFAFDVAAPSCMRTVAGRVLNELFRARLYTLLLTFHGGTNVLGYEWGDWGHCPRPPPGAPPAALGHGRPCDPAPDDAAMQALGERLSAAAGTGGGVESAYPVGTMGALVYPVGGGMEDWAYGASWSARHGEEPAAVVCKPSTLGGYPAEKTTVGNSTNRCVTYLIETAQEKMPPETTLGKVGGVRQLLGGGDGDGHVPRNVRLMVAGVDGVGVSVDVVAVGGVAVEPAASLWPTAKSSATDDTGTTVEFYVGGAHTVDAASLHVSTAAGASHPLVTAIGPVTGKGGTPAAPGTRFRLTMPVPPAVSATAPSTTPVYLRVAVRVDSALATNSPQSHLVNTRVDGGYRHEVGDSVVQGHSVWYSRTLRVTTPRRGAAGGAGAAAAVVIDMTGTPEGVWDGHALTPPPDAAGDGGDTGHGTEPTAAARGWGTALTVGAAAAATAAVLGALAWCTWRRWQRRAAARGWVPLPGEGGRAAANGMELGEVADSDDEFDAGGWEAPGGGLLWGGALTAALVWVCSGGEVRTGHRVHAVSRRDKVHARPSRLLVCAHDQVEVILIHVRQTASGRP